VVGAGIVGLAAASALRRAGVAVRCFEQATPGHAESAGLTRIFRFASLRRDEQRAWDANPHVRPEFVVPAISARDFTALPRLVATSVWPLTERLIGTRTLRRNHLKVLLALIALWQRMQRDGAATGSDAVVALIRTYGRSLSAPAQADGAEWTETLHMLAERELGDIEPLDGEERHAAAVGMARLEPKAQLWGREGPYPEE
jgi:hypothetical protein